MVSHQLTAPEVYQLLENVRDPEIPLLSVIDMAIIREVIVNPNEVVVTITPTYSGCPAMDMISQDITRTLTEAGIPKVLIQTKLSPAWTTDWMSETAKEKLRQSAIAAPGKLANEDLVPFPRKKIACPFCNSRSTSLKSEFGSTACKAMYFCDACHQPFEFFKPI